MLAEVVPNHGIGFLGLHGNGLPVVHPQGVGQVDRVLGVDFGEIFWGCPRLQHHQQVGDLAETLLLQQAMDLPCEALVVSPIDLNSNRTILKGVVEQTQFVHAGGRVGIQDGTSVAVGVPVAAGQAVLIIVQGIDEVIILEVFVPN